MIQFQEDNLGKNASKPTPLTRLPVRNIISHHSIRIRHCRVTNYVLVLQMKCFMDFRSGGALCHILASVYKSKCEQGWRKFDLQVSKVWFRVGLTLFPSLTTNIFI